MARPLSLTPEVYVYLGVLPDTKVAEMAGVTPNTVFNWRKRFNIPSCHEQQRDPEVLARTAVDRERRKRAWLGLPFSSDTAPRAALERARGMRLKSCPQCHETGPIDEKFGWRLMGGKPVPQSWCRGCRSGSASDPVPEPQLKRGRGRPPIHETAEEKVDRLYPGLRSDLYRMNNTNTGKKHGLSRERVRQFRDSLGLPPYGVIEKQNFDEEFGHLLGTMFDRELAKKSGKKLNYIQKARAEKGIPPFRWKEEVIGPHRDRLGKISDGKLARELGVHPGVVSTYRNQLGIPPFCQSGRVRKHDYELVKALFEAGASDTDIATALGTSEGVVQGLRKKLGLHRRPDWVNNGKPKGRKYDYDVIRRLNAEGLNDKEIAARLGAPYGTISIIRRDKLKLPAVKNANRRGKTS